MRSMRISRILDELTTRGVGSLPFASVYPISCSSIGPMGTPSRRRRPPPRDNIILTQSFRCRKNTEISQRVFEAYGAVILVSIFGGALRDELVFADIAPTPDDPQPSGCEKRSNGAAQ